MHSNYNPQCDSLSSVFFRFFAFVFLCVFILSTFLVQIPCPSVGSIEVHGSCRIFIHDSYETTHSKTSNNDKKTRHRSQIHIHIFMCTITANLLTCTWNEHKEKAKEKRTQSNQRMTKKKQTIQQHIWWTWYLCEPNPFCRYERTHPSSCNAQKKQKQRVETATQSQSFTSVINWYVDTFYIFSLALLLKYEILPKNVARPHDII